MVQEVGRVGPRRAESVAVSSRGTEALQMQKVYEQGQSRPERPLQFNGRGSRRSIRYPAKPTLDFSVRSASPVVQVEVEPA